MPPPCGMSDGIGAVVLEGVPRRRVRLPWLETSPITDLTLTLSLLPLWWTLGVEQLIWMPVGLVALAKVLAAQNGRLKIPPFALSSVMFLLVHAASGLFIVERFRIITFSRNFSAYLGATLWVLVLVNSIRSTSDARRVLRSIGVAMLGASIIGIAGIVGIWQAEWHRVDRNAARSEVFEDCLGTLGGRIVDAIGQQDDARRGDPAGIGHGL